MGLPTVAAKGVKSGKERQLLPLSKEAIRLLGEVKALLEQAYGEIPTVSPTRSNTKYEHLKPERYLFQWDASADGAVRALNTRNVQALLRFILHGLDLFTTQGKPIRVSVHVIRHVMAFRGVENILPKTVKKQAFRDD